MLLPVGTVLGERYRLVRQIGRGGMGAVYEAEQLDLGRKVAVKVLFETDARSVQRLRQEALAAAAIRSPHVAVVLDFQARPGEPPFLVMELLEGESLLVTLARERRLAPDRAVRIATSVLAALDEAHRAGVVHRDVKPSNVWLSRTAVGELVKLLDFGIVKQADGVKTTTGSVLGTPPYLSPEQLLGSPVEARSDLHAIGVLLFEMLAGERPWRRDQLTQDIVLRPPPVELLPPDVPAGVVEVIKRALEKKPSDRFGSAREMMDALARSAALLATAVPTPVSGILSRPPPSSMISGSSRPRARRRRTSGVRVFLLATGGALLVGAVVVGGVIAKRRAAARPVPSPPIVVVDASEPVATTAPDASEPEPEPPVAEERPAEAEAEAGASAPAGAKGSARNACTCVARFGSSVRRLCIKPLPSICHCDETEERTGGPCPSGIPCVRSTSADDVPMPESARGKPCAVQYDDAKGTSHRDGQFYCSTCYGNVEAHGPMSHGSPCRGYGVLGDETQGRWWCRGHPEPRF